MNSSNFGQCETSCKGSEYADDNTLSCYECQDPCLSCISATKCKTCIEGYLLYGNECIQGSDCPLGSFLHPTLPICENVCP